MCRGALAFAAKGTLLASVPRMLRRTAGVQGAYFIMTGLWPILHLPSFEAVTGPKMDGWLVKTLGGLITAVGTALLVAEVEGSSSRKALRGLGIGSAVALGLADGVYACKGRISRVYLLDLLAEAAIVAAWLTPSRGPEQSVAEHERSG
jgi:hypothetical protein